VIGLLVEGIKEMDKQINSLTKKLNKLEEAYGSAN
jgi:hypothetical protein